MTDHDCSTHYQWLTALGDDDQIRIVIERGKINDLPMFSEARTSEQWPVHMRETEREYVYLCWGRLGKYFLKGLSMS